MQRPILISITLAVALAGCGDDEQPAVKPPAAAQRADTGGSEVPAQGVSGADDSAAEAAADTDDDGGVDIISPPIAPADYGLLKPPVEPPAEAELTMHALSGYEVVAVYSKPEIKAKKLGYMRLGQRVRTTKKLEIEDEDCRKGWYHLEGGGFACASKGLVVESKPPYMYKPPPRPATEKPLPYEYAYVKRWNTPMYWRMANGPEMQKAKELRIQKEAEREGLPPPGAEPAPAPAGTAPAPNPTSVQDAGAAADVPALPSVTDEKPAVPEPKPAPQPTPAAADKPAAAPVGADAAGADAEPEEEEPEIKLPLNPETPWLEKGFFLSVAEKMQEGGRAWWKTARGGYVEGNAAYIYDAKDFQGQLLDEIEYPFGWAMDDPTRVFVLEGDDQLKPKGKLEQRTFVNIEEEVEIRGTTYLRLADQTLVRKKDVRMPSLQPLPDKLQPWERWVDVSLTDQILVAYEGARPVFATLVSTGRKGTEEEPFDTPTGRWRVRSKHISTTMDGNTASDGNYSIQDVPWAMFFEGSYALHGAFWHRGFGYRRSHGCVNLGPSDAKWLFYWTTPFLPEGWHGVHSNETAPGTTVIVRE